MNNQKRKKSTVAMFLAFSILMTSGLTCLVSSPVTSVQTVTMQSDIVSSYMNNSVRDMVSEVIGIENVRVLPYDFSAPKSAPNPANFTMGGADGKDYYKDSTIEVVCWEEDYHDKSWDTPMWFAEIKIKHASQLRRQWSNGDYASNNYQYPSNMFKSSNGVVGMSDDFYKHRKYGVIIQYGTVICNKRSGGQKLDVLTIDYNGDFKIWSDSELSEKIENEGADDIMLSFTFGPVIVQDGKAVDATHWEKQVLGELDQRVGRAGIGQLGELHYLLCTVGNPGLTCKQFAQVMEDKGCQIAYNMDGGQSGTLLFNGQVYNEIAYRGVERAMSDILYFGSAE